MASPARPSSSSRRMPNAKSRPETAFDLPPPAVAPDRGSSPKSTKIARIEGGLKVHWSRLKRRIGTGSGISESIIETGGGGSDTTTKTRDRRDTVTTEEGEAGEHRDFEEDEVDQVVVENDLDEVLNSSEPTNSNEKKIGNAGNGGNGAGFGATTSQVDTEDGTAGTGFTTQTHHSDNGRSSSFLYTLLRWRIFPAIAYFFAPRFYEPETERQYRKEVWYTSKSIAVWSAIFFVVNWTLNCAFAVKPYSLPDLIFRFGFVTLTAVPLPIFVIFDMPHRYPMTYQIYLSIIVWCWSMYELAYMYGCGFYGPLPFTCGTRDFIGLFYYATAMPTLALFALQQSRLATFIGTIIFIVLNCVWIVPFHHNWIRNLLNFAIFMVFIMFCHYKRETSGRRLYSLRDQLKIQFRATQKAQVNERKASDSKRRLTSYVFHEVRVPLNTALLAVQNMAATGEVPKDHELEWAALEGSLSMMSKVLNDVLDFNRMDSGRFSTVEQPYTFHQAIRSMLVPLKLAADSRGLSLDVNLDKTVDEIARTTLYAAQGHDKEWIAQRASEYPDEEGVVLGDEMRLRQIITNLASNACKFTPAGGTVTVITELLPPEVWSATARAEQQLPLASASITEGISEKKEKTSVGEGVSGISVEQLSRHNSIEDKQVGGTMSERMVVRISVQDTGVGIKAKELVDNKLFSPYVQTEIGKYQGGKGTGLGLALVRRIVKLSGGRLGVKSKLGEGSTFWVELPLGIGAKVLADQGRPEFRERESSHPSGKLGRGWDPGLKLNEVQPFTVSSTPDLTLLDIGRDPISVRPDPGPSSSQDPQLPFATRGQTIEQRRTRPTTPPQPDVPDSNVSADKSAPLTLALPLPSRGFHGPLSPPLTRPEKAISVLVVDDDPLTRSLMKRMLTRLGCVVDTAENGKVALEKLLLGDNPLERSPAEWAIGPPGRAGGPSSVPSTPSAGCPSKYDVIFLDNQMPIMSGLDTVAKLRELGRTDLVIGVTGNALLSDQKEYLEAGVDSVLTKPVLERSLRAMLALADQRNRNSLADLTPPSIHEG